MVTVKLVTKEADSEGGTKGHPNSDRLATAEADSH